MSSPGKISHSLTKKMCSHCLFPVVDQSGTTYACGSKTLQSVIKIRGVSINHKFCSLEQIIIDQTCHNDWKQAVRTHPDVNLKNIVTTLFIRSVDLVRRSLTTCAHFHG